MSTDMTGRKVRATGSAGERYREARERRARESRERREKFWADRMAAAQTPLQAFRVSVDRLSTAVIQRERRAAVAYDRIHGKQPASRQDRAAKTRLDNARSEITADLMWLSEHMLEIATRHETNRVLDRGERRPGHARTRKCNGQCNARSRCPGTPGAAVAHARA